MGLNYHPVSKCRFKVSALDIEHPCFVYVLACVGTEKPTTYVGWTTDVEKRLIAHNTGKGAKSTRGRTWVVIHTEVFRNKSAALKREWHLKRDRKFRKSLLDSFLAQESS